MISNIKNGFFRIEAAILIVVLVIAALVLGLSFLSAKTEARDKKRVIDITQIQTALNVYFTENGFYPATTSNGIPDGIKTYLDFWPTPPGADGGCSAEQNNYTYVQKEQGANYLLTFCLGRGVNALPKGYQAVSAEKVH
jgi:type II secretory pathway pseudopilin PulG